MHKFRHSVLITACFCMLVGVGFAAKIKTNYDKSANFAGYKKYAWGTNLEPARGPAYALMLKMIIDTELRARGLEETDDEANADLIVRYQATSDSDMNFGGTLDPTNALVGGMPLPGSTVWTSGFAMPSSGRYVRKGALVIDIFDLAQHKLIWSSMATDTMKAGSPDKVVNQVGKIVKDMFNEYPRKKTT